MSGRITSAMLATLALTSLSTAHSAPAARDNPGHLGWLAYFSGEFGGDDVATVLFTNGKSQDVKAGQGIGLGGGGHYRFANSGWDLGATIGLKYVTTQANNADIHISRMVLQFNANYLFNNNVWIGIGPELHQSIKFDAGGLGPNIDFDNATGLAFKAGWKWIALRYTNIEYQDTTRFKNKYDASSFGIELLGRF